MAERQTKEKRPSLIKRCWKGVIYPDSSGFDWKCENRKKVIQDLVESLEDNVPVPLLLSPIHDKDLLKSGEPEKEHIHFILAFSGRKKYGEALALMEPYGVKILKAVDDLPRDEKYMCHLESKVERKYHYPIEELIPINGYQCKYLGERQEENDFKYLHNLIEENGIILFADFGYTVSQQYPELIKTMTRYFGYFNCYLTSRERIMNRVMKKEGLKSEKKITALMSSYKSYRVRFGGVECDS